MYKTGSRFPKRGACLAVVSQESCSAQILREHDAHHVVIITSLHLDKGPNAETLAMGYSIPAIRAGFQTCTRQTMLMPSISRKCPAFKDR